MMSRQLCTELAVMFAIHEGMWSSTLIVTFPPAKAHFTEDGNQFGLQALGAPIFGEVARKNLGSHMTRNWSGL